MRNLYSFPNVIRTIKSSRIELAGNGARMERRGILTGFWWECQKERDQ
jgi:hypothetical protein